jgi:hypothetical protein
VLPQLVELTTILVEQASIRGGHWNGFTVTEKLHIVLLLQESVAVQMAVVVPGGKVLPLGGLHITVTGEQPPLAVLV